MTGTSIPVLYYWGGNICYGEQGSIWYDMNARRSIMLRRGTTYTELLAKMYAIMKVDITEFCLKMICRFPINHNNYKPLEVADDETVQTMIEVVLENQALYGIALYVEKENVHHPCAVSQPLEMESGFYTRLLTQDNDGPIANSIPMAHQTVSPILINDTCHTEHVSPLVQVESEDICNHGINVNDCTAISDEDNDVVQLADNDDMNEPGELSFLKYGGLVENNQNVDPMGFLSLLGEKLDRTPGASDNIFPGGIPNAAGLTCENLLQSQLQMPERQQFKQPNHQPYVHFDEAYEGQSQCYSVEQDECFNETARQKASNLPLLPSEQPDRVPHVASKSSVLLFGPTGTSILADSRNLVLHEILISYIIFKSMPVSTGGGQTAFVNYMHLMKCNGIVCNCDRYWFLVSHFDHCRYSACNICGPVRRFFVTGKLNQGSRKSKMGLSRAFDDRDLNRTSSNINDDILPPFKRLKMENPSFDNGVSHAVAPSMNQHRSPEQPPHLQQGREVLLSDNSDAVGMDEELISPILNSDTVPVLPKELIEDILPLSECLKMGNPASFGNGVSHAVAPSMLQHCAPEQPPHLQQWHEALVSDNSDAIGIGKEPSSQVLSSDTVPVLSKELIRGHKQEIRVRTKDDEAKPESKGELIAPAADVSGMKLDVPNIFGASLTDFFTADQLNEHISSLRLWIDQSIPKNISGNSMAHLVGENSCQLCSIDKLVFAPAPKYCSSCGAHIKRNLFYYCGPDEMGTQHCFCTSCFRSSRKGKISLNGTSISKGKLHKDRNNEENEESWVQCDKCKRWQHQICALYNEKRDLEGKAEYICPKCCIVELEIGERMPLPEILAFRAKDLPRTMLSDHIERRLFRCLMQEREGSAKALGKNLDEVPEAADLVVRVVFSFDKQLKVKQQFLDIFHDKNYPSEFQYRSKVILLFQKIQGVDVCLFGMYIQEYGSHCGGPNQRCVYISYLDSVKFFRPERESVTGEALRTFVYHEILIGYLDYCKKRGFVTCYIWICPPLREEDYILYCHPKAQKKPKSDKLRQWYKAMLRKAATENIVVDITNLYDQFFFPNGECNKKITAAHLPYFDGDYWSGAAEDMIKSIKQESGGGLQRKVKKMTKRALKAMERTNPSGDASKDILLMQKLGQTILPMKEDFVVVHLQFSCTRCHEVILSGSRWFCNQCKSFQLCTRCHDVDGHHNEGHTHTSNNGERHLLSQVVVNDVPVDTEDKDIINLDNGFFENGHTFLSFCQANNYQFDKLRRAKHSSMMILYHLQNTERSSQCWDHDRKCNGIGQRVILC